MLNYTCAGCGVELVCKKNGVVLVHFIDSDPEKGIDAVKEFLQKHRFFEEIDKMNKDL